ncbi:MAG: PAS domain S-box protein [Bacteroidales bacterium]|nr:PAS domain S-box protein [Bacteroidales bacterium]
MKKNPNTNHLPALLNKYAESDYILQQRAKFIYYLCIILGSTAMLLIGFRLLSGFISPVFDQSLKVVVLPLTSHIFIILLCLWLLRKGYYNFTANLILLLIMVTNWLIMFFEKQSPLIILDNVVYILAVLSMLPLIFTRRKSMILVYTAINIVILFVFMHYYKSLSGITRAEMWDYLVDVTVTMALIGIVGYTIYNINKTALDKAESDIKKRIDAEAALLKSEKKFRDMTDLLPQTIYESDLNGKLTYINKAGTNMFGYSFDDVAVGLNVFETIIEADHERVRQNIGKITKGESTHGSQYLGKRKDGTTFPMQIYSSVIMDGNTPMGFRGVIFDVSDLTKAYEDLQKRDELFRTLVDSSPIAITLSDLNENIILGNKAFYRETGLTPEKTIGKCPWELGIKGNIEKEKWILEQLKTNGYVDNFETEVWYANNVKHIIYVFAALIDINNQKVNVRYNINVTEKKMLENQIREYTLKLEDLVKERTAALASTMEELKSTNEELQSTNDELYRQREQLEVTLYQLRETQEQLIQTEKMASLGILTAGVAHEINNPINYICNGSVAIENYISEHIPEHLENLKPLFEAINTGVERTTDIVKSLSSYSRKEKFAFHKCQIHQILENCLTILYNQYKNRIEIKREFCENLPEIHANESTLHQAFLNILTNAIQAIDNEGMIIIKTEAEKETVSISISDNGKGVKEEDLSYIFDPFFTTKDPGKGTGLGLSIVQRIVKEHQGSINCKSRLNHGAEFIVNLPVNPQL